MALPHGINYNDFPEALKNDVNSTTMEINHVNSKSYYTSGDIIIFES